MVRVDTFLTKCCEMLSFVSFKRYVDEFVNVVEFITLKKAMGTDGKRQQPGHSRAGRVPVQAKLCSYACFMKEGHRYVSLRFKI